jgi:hypothetical protein
MSLKTILARTLSTVALLFVTAPYAFADAPQINNISPNRVSTTPSSNVTISGSNFTGTTSVTFGGVNGTLLTVVNENTITVRPPAHGPGVVDVVVTNPEGSATLANGLFYGNVPLALDDSFTTPFNTPLQVFPPGVFSNDNDGSGGEMHTVLGNDVSTGTLSLSVDGGFIYTPPPGFTGTVTFSYRPENAAGTGNLATVSIIVAAPTGPLVPTGLYVSAMNGNTLTLRWTSSPFGLPATNHVLEGGTFPGEVLNTISTGSGGPIFTFTAPSGVFFLRVRAVSGSQQSAPSNEIRVFLDSAAGRTATAVTPSAPENLLGLVNGASLVLSWRNTFAGTEPTSLALDVSGSVSTSLSVPLSDTFTFSGVPPGTYTFSMRALNASGSSAPSSPVTLTFPGPCSGPPATPANFVAYKVGNVLNVAWDLPATGPAPTGYVLNVGGSLSGTFFSTSRQMSGTVAAGAYTLSVVAANPCGTSAATASSTVSIP